MKLVLLDENCAEATARVGPGDDSESTENASVFVTRIQSCTHLTRPAPGCSSQTRRGWGHRGHDYDRANCAKIIDFIRDYEIHGIFILVKPNSARLTLTFKFCVEEPLVTGLAGLCRGRIVEPCLGCRAGCDGSKRVAAAPSEYQLSLSPIARPWLPYEWRPCGRALGDSPRVGSMPVSESVHSAALK